MFTPIRTRINTSGTTHVITDTRYVSQIVISVEDPGTTWTLRIEDNSATPFVLVGKITLAAQNDGPIILNFKDPVRMSGGIDIVTAGTAGEVTVYMNFGQPST